MTQAIKIYKNFLKPHEQDKIERKILEPKWVCNHSSTTIGLDASLFWRMDLDDDEFFSVYMMKRIEEVTGDQFKMERIYFNGHNACSGGGVHKDSNDENGRTFLIYCNKIWLPEYSGGTSFIINDEVHTVYPHPKSAVCFQNNIDHFANTISKDFKGIRVTLAFKLWKI